MLSTPDSKAIEKARKTKRATSAGVSNRARLRRIKMVMLFIGVGYLGAAFALDRYGLRSVHGQFDAIVVAGCRVMPNGQPSPALQRRTDVAVDLWKRGVAPTIVLTGGVGDGPRSEAEAAAEWAEREGVPRSALVLEQTSTSTDENARFAAELMPDASDIVVVSDAYHVFRCERVFGRYFESVRGAGSRGQPWPRFKGAMREVVAVTAYGVLRRL